MTLTDAVTYFDEELRKLLVLQEYSMRTWGSCPNIDRKVMMHQLALQTMREAL